MGQWINFYLIVQFSGRQNLFKYGAHLRKSGESPGKQGCQKRMSAGSVCSRHCCLWPCGVRPEQSFSHSAGGDKGVSITTPPHHYTEGKCPVDLQQTSIPFPLFSCSGTGVSTEMQLGGGGPGQLGAVGSGWCVSLAILAANVIAGKPRYCIPARWHLEST